MLHPQECKTIIEMAASVADRKYNEAVATKKEMENVKKVRLESKLRYIYSTFK